MNKRVQRNVNMYNNINTKHPHTHIKVRKSFGKDIQRTYQMDDEILCISYIAVVE